MLTVKNNYFYENDKPFFWLGDTAWLLFDKLSNDEIKLYLNNRKVLGFNVIQAVLVYAIPEFETTSGMPHGDKNVKEKAYYENVKLMIDYARSLGIYVALLPTWGSFVQKGYLNEQNVDTFAKFLCKVFKDSENLIWVLGGDVRGDNNLPLFNKLGTILKSNFPNNLCTFHPFGRTGSYLWFNNSGWLDFNMFQSGHRRYDQLNLNVWDDARGSEDSFGEDCWKYVVKNNGLTPKKPCLDAEPSYEGIVQGLHDEKEPYWEARHARRYAYWSVFEGACGYTFGNNAVIQFYKEGERKAYGVRETWQTALHSEGAGEMQFLKQLMLSVDFTSGKAHPEYVLENKERHHRTSVFASNSFLFAYTYKGDQINLDLSAYTGKTLQAFWMNPQNGSKSYIGEFKNSKTLSLRPNRRHELSNDWVLILTTQNI